LFVALEGKYGPAWTAKTNAFLYAAGFMGALDFLRLKLIPYCNIQQSFTRETISDAIDMPGDKLILQSEIKGFGGSKATGEVFERLVQTFKPAKQSPAKFKI